MGGLKFEDVAAAALAMAPLLLSEWLGGGPKGHEWLGASRSNGGRGDSWSVNLNTGQFAHFAGPEKGGDLVALYAALNHLDQGAALKQVAELVGVTNGAGPRTLPPGKAPESPCEPIPQDPPDLPRHSEFGHAAEVYAYGRAFWIARYEVNGKKSFSPFTWRRGKWSRLAYPDPRPIYNLDQIAKNPTVQVLIVEGEKCADAAIPLLRALVITTWANGAGSVHKNDWSPLKGREVLIWPDADEPGRQAAATLGGLLSTIAARVRVIQPDRADGWDVADAIAQGMSELDIYGWLKTHTGPDIVPQPTPPAAAPSETESSPDATEDSGPATAEPALSEYLPAKEHPRAEDYPDGQPAQSFMVAWQALRLDTDTKKIPHATLANASAIIQRHEYFRGKVWLDSFRGKVYHTLNGAPRLWTDADDRRVCAWIQQQLQLPKINLNLVKEATLHAAECDQRNSLTDWLDSLEWDGIERLETWLFDCLGAERGAYNDAVARNWLISMVARAYSPGCQVDTMPVIEGTMGRGKSRFLEVLAEPWFAAIQIAFGEKDFFQAIQGRWLIEVPDMSGFSRREHTQILATITTRCDVYRKSHGRITEEHPRVTVFAATSESDDYLQDVRGRRRYWPLRCGEINLDALRGQREQLFAEAVSRYRAGATWYEMPEQTDEEQILRASHDMWANRVIEEAEAMWAQPNPRITSTLLLTKVGVELKDQDDGKKGRVARIMRSHNWLQRNNDGRYWKKIVRLK